MAQRQHNLSKWCHLPEGRGASFEGDRRRIVRLEVNAPSEVSLYVLQDVEQLRANPERKTDKAAGRPNPLKEGQEVTEVTFLALVKGRDTIEFGVDGPFKVLAEGGDAWVYTVDGQQWETNVVAPVIFTRLANRRQRNPHLEMMQYQMRLNQEAFQRNMLAESERRIQALERKLETYAPQRNIRAPAALVGGTETGATDGGTPSATASGQAGTDAPEGAAGSGVSGGTAVSSAAPKPGRAKAPVD